MHTKLLLTLFALFLILHYPLSAQETGLDKTEKPPSGSPSELTKEEAREEKKVNEDTEEKKGDVKDSVSENVSVDEEDMDILLEEDDDLLILDDEEEMFIEEKPTERKVAEEAPLKKEGAEQITEKAPAPDSLQQKEKALLPPEIVETEGVILDEPEQIKTISPDKEKSKKPAVIESARSINFAGNLKEYRSPKKALFMSLLLPGLGQAYAKNYWKTALFGVIEASLIGFAVKNAVDGRDKLEKARDFADKHYRTQDFFNFYEDFIEFTRADTLDLTLIFGDSLDYYKNLFTDITNKSHDINARKDFDKFIGEKGSPFVQGWDDCNPSFSSSGYDISDTSLYFYKYFNNDTTWVINRYKRKSTSDTTLVLLQEGIFGYSQNQGTFNDMVSESNRFYDVSRYLVFSLVANHVASAIDAFITARAFNDKLLQKESLWQRINIDHQLAFAPDGFRSRFGIRVRF